MNAKQQKSAVHRNCAAETNLVQAAYSLSYLPRPLSTGTGTRAGLRGCRALGSRKSSISFSMRRPTSSSSSQTLRLRFATAATFHWVLSVFMQQATCSNGPKGTRTPDFHNAIVALSQLSYRPALTKSIVAFFDESVNMPWGQWPGQSLQITNPWQSPQDFKHRGCSGPMKLDTLSPEFW